VLAFLADENFDGDIVVGVRRRLPQIDIVRVQDVGLARVDDPVILTWAADTGRLLRTHDVATVRIPVNTKITKKTRRTQRRLIGHKRSARLRERPAVPVQIASCSF
jgi:hypothetical protein